MASENRGENLPSSGSFIIQCWKLMAAMCFSALVICACSGYNFYYYYGWGQIGIQSHTIIPPAHQIFRTGPTMVTTAMSPSLRLLIDSTHVNGKLMEPVNAKWDRNVFFAIKTTTKFLNSRIHHLMLTWFQAVDKDMLAIINENIPEGKPFAEVARQAGFSITEADCDPGHNRNGLCCKTGYEYAAYYEALEKYDRERLEWFCHIDDDMYVNVEQLSGVLRQYDPADPYYIGAWHWFGHHRIKQPMVDMLESKNYTVKKRTYHHAPGAIYCISHSLMMELESYINGIEKLNKSCRFCGSDDLAIGFIIGIILGHDLNTTAKMANQYYPYLKNSSLEQLSQYATISSRATNILSLNKYGSSLHIPIKEDPLRFSAYHCLLYPEVSWCKQ